MKNKKESHSKYLNISAKIFFSYLLSVIFIIPFLSYWFNNYWLLFGIVFSYFGYFFYYNKPSNLFFTITFLIILYWISEGFKFSEPITFFWFSYFIANLFKGLNMFYEGLANNIISNIVNDINYEIKDQVKYRQMIDNYKNNNNQNS